jgi:hypothetical protein
MRMLSRMQVGTADAASQRPDQHLPWAWGRLRHRVNDDFAVSKDRSAHGLFLPTNNTPLVVIEFNA